MADDIVERLRSEAKTGNMPLGQSFDALVVADVIEARDAEIERLRAEVERLRALITEWDAAREALRRPPRQWSEGDWYDAEVRLGAAEGALIEEARRG